MVLSVRVTNKSGKTISVDGANGNLVYGPDGDQAEQIYDTNTDPMQGRIVSGKAKTGTYGYAIPKQHLDEVQLEFSWDGNVEHDAAIFIGSVA